VLLPVFLLVFCAPGTAQGPATAPPASAAPAPTVGIVAAGAAATSRHFLDDAGRDVVVPAVVRRVVALSPALTEMVYAVGAGPTLVATVQTSNWPPAARALPRIGDALRFDVERILALKPDLVLAWHHGNPARELAQLESAGLRLVRFEPTRLDEIPRTLERLGDLLGHTEAGRAQGAAFRTGIESLRTAHRIAAPVSVFYQVWSSPLMTLNRHHVVSDVLALCGGRNVFGDLPQLVPQLSTESVLAANPEVLLTARDDLDPAAGVRRDPALPAYAAWRRFHDLEAVRRGWLFEVSGDIMTRPGPRLLDGARAVCAALDGVRGERAARR
jgi:iron complex transport system substrate-binding protein